jgi:uncharacterized protein YcfJ
MLANINSSLNRSNQTGIISYCKTGVKIVASTMVGAVAGFFAGMAYIINDSTGKALLCVLVRTQRPPSLRPFDEIQGALIGAVVGGALGAAKAIYDSVLRHRD